jgi:hypothetical protein
VAATASPLQPTPEPTQALVRRGPERTTALEVEDVREAAAAVEEEPANTRVHDAVVAEQPYPPPRRRSRLPLVLAGLALLAALGLVAALVLDRSGTGPLSALGGDDPSASAEPSAGPAALPAGWTRYEEPDEGWSIGVPPGYEQSTYRETQVQLRDPKTRRTLRIDFSDDPAPSALQAWEAFSPQLATRLGDYEELRVEKVEFQGLDAATWSSPTSTRRRCTSSTAPRSPRTAAAGSPSTGRCPSRAGRRACRSSSRSRRPFSFE